MKQNLLDYVQHVNVIFSPSVIEWFASGDESATDEDLERWANNYYIKLANQLETYYLNHGTADAWEREGHLGKPIIDVTYDEYISETWGERNAEAEIEGMILLLVDDIAARLADNLDEICIDEELDPYE